MAQGENPLWYRVAGIRPRLVAHSEITRQVFRGDTWYVLHNLATAKSYRFTPRFHHFVALLDGKRTVEAAWHVCSEALGDDALSQDEAMEVLARLYLADVLQSDQAGAALDLFERQRRMRQAARVAQAKNPLAIKLPLFDPDRLLATLAPAARLLFSWGGLVAWLALVTLGVVTAFSYWDRIGSGEGPQLLSAGNLLILGLCYPCVKALHELGHGLATKVWGGEVHQAGLLLVAFMPLPYVDATASNAFPERHRRVVVSAAGIMVELALATLALFAWLTVEPGLVRDIAFNVMLIGSVSTLLFNGNPLMRFDGYYVMTDAAGLPNLASRANKYLGYLVKRYVFALSGQRSPCTHPSEPAWLFGYGVASYFYRIFITLVIALFVAETYPTIGVALALWSLGAGVVWPVAKHTAKLVSDPEFGRRRGRAVGFSLGAVTLGAAIIFALPAPLATVTEGVVAPPEDAEIRAGRAGMFARFIAAPGAVVAAGDPLATLDDPFIALEVERLEARLRELTARRAAVLGERKQVEADILDEQIAVTAQDLAKARADYADLTIPSPTAGVFLVARTDDLTGRYLEQGELLGYVADLERPTVRVAVDQADIGLVKAHSRGVSVRLADHPAHAIDAAISRQVPGVLERLPSAALGAQGGGLFAVDPTDASGTRPVAGVFEIELTLPIAVERLGGRAYVRFDHGAEPLGSQWFRRVRQLFLGRFGV